MPPRCGNGPSAAKLFVQLANNARQSCLPEVFSPRQTRAFRIASAAPRTKIDSTIQRNVAQHPQAARLARRDFSATTLRRKTQAIHNAQVDENGEDMLLEITPRAAQRLTRIMAKDNNPHLALRIQVESGGCHGFQYQMGLVTLPSLPASNSGTSTPEPPSEATEAELTPSTTTTAKPLQSELREDDTVFAFAKDDAPAEAEQNLAAAPKIVLDGPSLDLLKGSKLDFTMELIGSQFKIVDNPAATSSCGCGTSFDIKM